MILSLALKLPSNNLENTEYIKLNYKLVMLRLIKSKSAIELAAALLDILTIIVSAILQSENGKEFRNQVLRSLKVMWPDINFVHGRESHTQSQGSTE